LFLSCARDSIRFDSNRENIIIIMIEVDGEDELMLTDNLWKVKLETIEEL